MTDIIFWRVFDFDLVTTWVILFFGSFIRLLVSVYKYIKYGHYRHD